MIADPHYRRDLAAIHIAKKDAGLDDDTYRALISRLTNGRCESAARLSPDERARLLDRLKGRSPQTARRDDRPQARKLRALWLCLWNLGAARSQDDKALAAFVKRHTGLDAIQWAGSDEISVATDCLLGWCRRLGYEPKRFHAELQTPMEGSFKPALIEAQWARLAQLGAFRTGEFARLETWLRRAPYGVAAPQFLTNKQADQAIMELGAWLRRVARGSESS